MSRKFIEQNRGAWIFVSSKGIQQEIIDALEKAAKRGESVLIHVDRKSNQWRIVSEKQWNKLEWHERLELHPSALARVKAGEPLAFNVDYDSRVRYGLGVYGCKDGNVARVAQKGTARVAGVPEVSVKALSAIETELRQLEETRAGKREEAESLRKQAKEMEEHAKALEAEVSTSDKELEKLKKAAELLRSQ